MDLTKKIYVITGANSGIGFETAKALAMQNAFIIMVCRNEERAQRAAQAIRNEAPNAVIDIVYCDFSNQSDIRHAAKTISEKYTQIDVLINNHGFIAAERLETPEGLETTFAVNHIGYFLFTNLLLEKLKAAPQARIINVASDAHRNGRFNADNLQLKTGFTPLKAYGNSKLFNILFTAEIARKLAETTITANSLHPGVVKSNFGKSSNFWIRNFWKLAAPFMISPQEGAQTVIYLAASEEIKGVSGAYFRNKKVVVPRTAARNMEYAKQLWSLSNALLGTDF